MKHPLIGKKVKRKNGGPVMVVKAVTVVDDVEIATCILAPAKTKKGKPNPAKIIVTKDFPVEKLIEIPPLPRFKPIKRG